LDRVCFHSVSLRHAAEFPTQVPAAHPNKRQEDDFR
jgi:hypothetical protein